MIGLTSEETPKLCLHHYEMAGECAGGIRISLNLAKSKTVGRGEGWLKKVGERNRKGDPEKLREELERESERRLHKNSSLRPLYSP